MIHRYPWDDSSSPIFLKTCKCRSSCSLSKVYCVSVNVSRDHSEWPTTYSFATRCSDEARFPARPVGRSGQGANGEVEADEADVTGSGGAGRSDTVVDAAGVSLGLREWKCVINETCGIAVNDQGRVSGG